MKENRMISLFLCAWVGRSLVGWGLLGTQIGVRWRFLGGSVGAFLGSLGLCLGLIGGSL